MSSISPKPYKLHNKIQHYEWGTRNEKAFIPNLLGIAPEHDLPYSELWIGSHPKSPSEIEIDGKLFPLNLVISENPESILGKNVFQKFGAQLPFLLKVLSAAKALSIQLHPNKKQAEVLHAKDPKNYPDDNHKPEIAISLDHLTALAGFLPVEEIKKNLSKHSEIAEFAGQDLVDAVLNSNSELDEKEKIKILYSAIMKKSEDHEALERIIKKWVARLSAFIHNSNDEIQFLKQNKLYGSDVGLFSFFFFNLVELKEGQAIFTDAGVPHAYIVGNIIECMANSDNVVRAGLTPKFKDVDTLLDIVVYGFSKFDIINDEQKKDDVIFKTAAKEFEITAFSKKPGFDFLFSSKGKPSVFLITDGSVTVSWADGSEFFKKGESFLVPASLKNIVLTSNGSANFYSVEIPD